MEMEKCMSKFSRHIASLVALSILAFIAAGSSEQEEKIQLTTNVVQFYPKTPSLIYAEFELENPTDTLIPSVFCSPTAFVDTAMVSKIGFQGGTLSNFEPNETRLTSTIIEINEQQAAYVNEVRLSCKAE